MGVTIIFLPSNIFHFKSGYLYGVNQTQENDISIFYILGLSEEFQKPNSDLQIEFIGDVNWSVENKSKPLASKKFWVSIRLLNSEICIDDLILNFSSVHCQETNIISLIYDPKMFLSSELLGSEVPQNFCSLPLSSNNYFEVLTALLRSLDCERRKCQLDSALVTLFFSVIFSILEGLKVFYSAICKLTFLMKYSSLGSHLLDFSKDSIWCSASILQDRGLTLKTGNYICGRIFDILCGAFTLYYLMECMTKYELFQTMANISEGVVTNLTSLIKWLMGSPAGFKLNAPFSSLLGKFYIYHVNLWWSFLVVARPMLEFMYTILLKVGLLGLSFQIAIVSDLLTVVSFHAYCIYVYAARLYSLQLSCMIMLFDLFIGRKRNPLPGQVDSSPYTTEQLFLGTLVFTVLFFLLPTTFIYYLIFTTLRAVIVLIGGFLNRITFLPSALPFFTFWQWLINSPRTCDSICVTAQKRNQNILHQVLFVIPVTSSLWKVAVLSLPDVGGVPPEVQWFEIIQNFVRGKLIYPI